MESAGIILSACFEVMARLRQATFPCFSKKVVLNVLRAEICRKKKIPWQPFAMRSDLPCGGTVGSIISAACGISTVDIGIAGWAMHSIRETVAAQDQISLCQLLKEVLLDAPES